VNPILRFAHFWYDFIVGDDWTLALAVVISLAATGYVAHAITRSSWFLLPLVIIVVLTASVWREARRKRSG